MVDNSKKAAINRRNLLKTTGYGAFAGLSIPHTMSAAGGQLSPDTSIRYGEIQLAYEAPEDIKYTNQDVFAESYVNPVTGSLHLTEFSSMGMRNKLERRERIVKAKSFNALPTTVFQGVKSKQVPTENGGKGIVNQPVTFPTPRVSMTSSGNINVDVGNQSVSVGKNDSAQLQLPEETYPVKIRGQEQEEYDHRKDQARKVRPYNEMIEGKLTPKLKIRNYGLVDVIFEDEGLTSNGGA